MTDITGKMLFIFVFFCLSCLLWTEYFEWCLTSVDLFFNDELEIKYFIKDLCTACKFNIIGFIKN